MIIVNVNATEDENDDESFQEVMVERMHAKGTVEGLLLSRCCLPLSWVQTFFSLSLLSERWVGLKSITPFAAMLQLTCVRTQMGSTYWKEWSALVWAVAMCKSLGFLSTCFRFELKIYLCHRCLRISYKHIYKHPQEMVQLLQEPSWRFYEGEMFCELDQTNPTNG